MLVTLALIAFVTAISPAERTLGTNLRVVLLHGAWVWAGLITIGAAALAGCTALLTRRGGWHSASRAMGQVGLIFLWVYLPMSLLVMQLNWGGIFWDEPRFRIPLTFCTVGLLLQVGLALINRSTLTSLANLLFGLALGWKLITAQNVLHPDSPVAQSGSVAIQAAFILLVVLCSLLSAQAVFWHLRRLSQPTSEVTNAHH